MGWSKIGCSHKKSTGNWSNRKAAYCNKTVCSCTIIVRNPSIASIELLGIRIWFTFAFNPSMILQSVISGKICSNKEMGGSMMECGIKNDYLGNQPTSSLFHEAIK
jgi:hypothetical protein